MVTWSWHEEVTALTREISSLRTKLAMREQSLREATALEVQLREDVAVRDIAIAELKDQVRDWRPIVDHACDWRDGADRGELAAAVDGYRGGACVTCYADGAGAQAWRQAMGGKT